MIASCWWHFPAAFALAVGGVVGFVALLAALAYAYERWKRTVEDREWAIYVAKREGKPYAGPVPITTRIHTAWVAFEKSDRGRFLARWAERIRIAILVLFLAAVAFVGLYGVADMIYDAIWSCDSCRWGTTCPAPDGAE